MRRRIAGILLLAGIAACRNTGDGLAWGVPSYEKRDIAVTETDLKILLRADQLLAVEGNWSRDGQRECAGAAKVSLFCALENASIDVAGAYVHRRAALQEVRFAIDDEFHDRWKEHRLADFNANPATSFSDVKKVLTIAEEHIRAKLAS